MKIAALALVLVLGCSRHDHTRPPDPPPVQTIHVDTPAVETIRVDTPPGVSDLTLDDRGTLWAIPERDPFLVEIALPSGAVVRHPLDGVPPGVDTESLTWLGPGRFAIGTEGEAAATASILSVEARGDRFAVTSERALTEDELGVHLTVNQGAEGLCGRGDDLLVAIETVGKLQDGSRWAPLVHLHAGQVVATSRLHLTSATGKASAITCTFAADGSADAYVIERHYEVSRLLHVRVPASAGEITPTIAIDLDAIFHGAYNLEGVVRLADGRFVLVNDNQGHKVEGPTELFVLRPP
jgi:hypothetical protein